MGAVSDIDPEDETTPLHIFILEGFYAVVVILLFISFNLFQEAVNQLDQLLVFDCDLSVLSLQSNHLLLPLGNRGHLQILLTLFQLLPSFLHLRLLSLLLLDPRLQASQLLLKPMAIIFFLRDKLINLLFALIDPLDLFFQL